MESLKNRISSLEEIIHSLNKRITSLEEINESLSKSSSSKSNVKKQPSEKKTNHPGPGAWNEFVKEVWRNMLEKEGHELPDNDGEFRKFAAKNGVTYKQALSEASKQKAGKEGREFIPKVKKEKEDKKEDKKAEEELFGEDEDEELTQEMKSIGCTKKMIDDVVYYYNPKSKEVFDMTAERLGKLVKGAIDETK